MEGIVTVVGAIVITAIIVAVALILLNILVLTIQFTWGSTRAAIKRNAPDVRWTVPFIAKTYFKGILYDIFKGHLSDVEQFSNARCEIRYTLFGLFTYYKWTYFPQKKYTLVQDVPDWDKINELLVKQTANKNAIPEIY